MLERRALHFRLVPVRADDSPRLLAEAEDVQLPFPATSVVSLP